MRPSLSPHTMGQTRRMEREGVQGLFRRPDFRRVYLAIAASELGDAFQYLALMWYALVAGGPLGVIAVRLADSVPALAFGFHGGLVADRLDRRRTMIAADLFRGALLVPIAVLGLEGDLPLWLLVVAAFALTAAASYFDPAYGALLPALVDRDNVQRANGLVRATADALSVGGWAAAAGLLAFMPISAFFGLNAASFFVSAALLLRRATRGGQAAALGCPSHPRRLRRPAPAPGPRRRASPSSASRSRSRRERGWSASPRSSATRSDAAPGASR